MFPGSERETESVFILELSSIKIFLGQRRLVGFYLSQINLHIHDSRDYANV